MAVWAEKEGEEWERGRRTSSPRFPALFLQEEGCRKPVLGVGREGDRWGLDLVRE